MLRLIDDLVRDRGMGLILISHDLTWSRASATASLVMYAGRDRGGTARPADLAQAQHPYTRGLLDCLPRLDDDAARLPVLTARAWGRT